MENYDQICQSNCPSGLNDDTHFNNKRSFLTDLNSVSFFFSEEDLLEGDIILTPKLRKFLNNQRDGKKITAFDAAVSKAWPGARVPYTFARGFSEY